MLGRSRATRDNDAEGSTRQPLLGGSQEDLHDTPHGDVLFTTGDDEDDDDYVEASALDHLDSPPTKPGHSVRFNEDVQVIAPPIRSMMESRETGA